MQKIGRNQSMFRAIGNLFHKQELRKCAFRKIHSLFMKLWEQKNMQERRFVQNANGNAASKTNQHGLLCLLKKITQSYFSF